MHTSTNTHGNLQTNTAIHFQVNILFSGNICKFQYKREFECDTMQLAVPKSIKECFAEESLSRPAVATQTCGYCRIRLLYNGSRIRCFTSPTYSLLTFSPTYLPKYLPTYLPMPIVRRIADQVLHLTHLLPLTYLFSQPTYLPEIC